MVGSKGVTLTTSVWRI